MTNPHLQTSKAILKDMQEKGWSVSKSRLIGSSLKRARKHRETNKGGR